MSISLSNHCPYSTTERRFLKENIKKIFLGLNIFENNLGQIIKVRIFWTRLVRRKHKSPDFLDKNFFAKTQKSGFFGVRILSKPLYIDYVATEICSTTSYSYGDHYVLDLSIFIPYRFVLFLEVIRLTSLTQWQFLNSPRRCI